MKVNKKIIMLISMLSTAQIYAAAEDVGIGEVRAVGDGCFAGKAMTAAGEIVYLGMEPLATDRKVWQTYKACTTLLNRMFLKLAEQFIPDLRDSSEEFARDLGFTQDEFKEFMKAHLARFSDAEYQNYNDIDNNKTGLLSVREVVQKLKETRIGSFGRVAESISSALNGFFPDYYDYVVYVSKTPVTGRFTPKKRDFTLSFKEYIEVYDNIIMSVGSMLTHSPLSFENRGIMKNPKYIFSGQYGNLAMTLHGFTAAVMKLHVAPEKIEMIVYPFGRMSDIIERFQKPGTPYTRLSSQPFDDKYQLDIEKLMSVYVGEKSSVAEEA